MIEIIIKTHKAKEVIDITDEINEKLKEEDFKEGLCHLFLTHTTAALTTADLDPGTDLDMLDALQAMIPKLAYRHPHNPQHVPDHILSSIIGTSLTVPVKEKLVLGTWQRVVLIEFNGPRERKINVSLFSEKQKIN
jgi:secondary thiamine-phosphate synthase enzyme